MQCFEHSERTLRVAVLAVFFCLSANSICGGQVPIRKSGSRKTTPPTATQLPPTPEAAAKPEPPPAEIPPETVIIPGPLRSFLRMAGMSQKALPDEIMPLLSQRVYLSGYQGDSPTEFLLLLRGYVRQARELQALAGPKNAIQVADCNDAAPLLQVLGYRMRRGCAGKDTVLETANPERAFLTIDSGFPLTDLEEALGKGAPFTYAYVPSRVPVLFRESDWVKVSATQKLQFGTCLDVLLNDPAVARLYHAMGNADAKTRHVLQGSIGLRALLPVAPVLDFYGSQISIRSGRVLVPGGTRAEAGWKNLVGASPQSPSAFVTHLLAKDDGWLAAYFDSLSRIDAAQQQRLTQSPRLQRYYAAFRTAEPKGKAAYGVFRQASELLILDARLRWDANGDPYIPGSLAVWKQLAQDKATAKMFREWKRRGYSMDTPDKLVEALTASARDDSEAGPLEFYLTLSELDRRRPADRQISAQTVTRLAGKFSDLSSWYLIFSEFPNLTDEAMVKFVGVVEGVEAIHNQSLRANAFGAFQANVGLWQILARQHQIKDADLDASWKSTIDPFAKITSPAQLFDSTRQSFREILRASGGDPDGAPSQIVDRLAGPIQDSPDARRIHDRLAGKIRAVLEDQQLASLDTLYALSDGLEVMAETGGRQTGDLLSLANELRGFELPRPVFTNSEKISWAPAVYTAHHVELQVQTDLTKVIKSPATRAQLEAARGQLAPFLRDTLVGLNYAYYEPPGAQILHANPLFVRAHDFLSISVIGAEQIWQPPVVVGAGVSAGGGAYLMGSLIDLPYALATAEQDFIVPENVQALIFREFVPVLMTSAMLPRWWSVTPNQLHAVGLYQRLGEELLSASVKDANIRSRVVDLLSKHVSPQRLEEITDAISRDGGPAILLPGLMPSETFYVAEEYRRLYPDEVAAVGPFGKELAELASRAPADVDRQTLSELFGVPHPTLSRSNAREILNVPPFPFSGGYTSRLFGESLESTNLYWARLADEMGYSPAMLHLLVPELTRLMAGKIFATNFEDVPALLRAMQEAGEDLRQGRVVSLRRMADVSTQAQSIGDR